MRSICFLICIIPFLLVSGRSSQVLLNFSNKTSEEFKELFVNVRGEEFTFKNLKSGESTARLKVKNTYGYCFARVITEKDTLFFRPIDFVGEKLYTNGKLTMQLLIKLDDAGRRTLEIDSRRPAF
jgi:hypothetical protein